MARPVLKVTKARRILIVRDVIARQRRVRKGALLEAVAMQLLTEALTGDPRVSSGKIAERVALELEAAKKALAVPVQEDLRDLQKFGEIDAEYFSLRNEPLELDDLEKEKTYHIDWVWKGASAEIIGAHLLEALRAHLFLDDSMTRARAVSVDYCLRDPKPDFINLIFNVGPTLLNLTLDQDEANFLLLIGRAAKPLFNPIEGARDRLPGKNRRRVGALLLPTETLSASRSEKKPGHFAVQIHDSDSVEVHDFESRNETWVKMLDLGEARRVSAALLADSDVTKTRAPRAAAASSEVLIGSRGPGFQKIEPGKGRRFRLPVLIKASQGFQMLIVAPGPS